MHYSFDYEYHCRLLVGGESPTLINEPLAALRVHAKSKGVAQRDCFNPERLAVAKRYAHALPFKDRLELYRNVGYRTRLVAINEANEGGPALWPQVVKHPWWLASHDIRHALSTHTASRHKEAA